LRHGVGSTRPSKVEFVGRIRNILLRAIRAESNLYSTLLEKYLIPSGHTRLSLKQKKSIFRFILRCSKVKLHDTKGKHLMPCY
jgi:hypothetical protein